MKDKPIDRQKTLLAGSIILTLIAAVLIFRGQAEITSAQLGAPPPQQPQFEGISVTESFPVPGLSTSSASNTPRQSLNGWEVIMTEDWEEGFDSDKWITIDQNGSQDGDYRWGVREVENPLGGGQQSAWSIGGGLDGELLDPATDGYPAGVNTWLIHGPINLQDANNVELSFNYAFEADARDTFSVLVSYDGTNWVGKQADDGGNGEWLGRNYSLADFAGNANVYLAFRFMSNLDGNQNKTAAFVDDIVLRGQYSSKQYLPHISYQASPTPPPTPTLTPTPVPSPTRPGTAYNNDFTSNITGWEVRRIKNGTTYELNHRGDYDGPRQGFLELSVKNQDGYAIVSPLVESKAPPYNIEFFAKLKNPRDRHMYGLIFAADWNGQDCNAPSSPNCFNQYYELRVQYRNLTGTRFQEVKLKRIDSHDGSGEPVGPTLIDFKRGGSVGIDDWVEIDVNVSADGKIQIYWNNKFIAEAQDTTLLNQRYFGLQLITKDKDNARVKYDYIKIE